MRRNLGRVLRIRALFEELSQLELETRTAELRQLESAAERQRRLSLAVRLEAHQLLTEPGNATTQAWLTGIGDAELLARKSNRLNTAAQKKKPVAEAAREVFLARRLERRQAETLVTAAAAADNKQELRRDQKQVDDWFQSRSARRKKNR